MKSYSCLCEQVIVYRENGDLVVWGDNKFGQLGLGSKNIVQSPTLLKNDPNVLAIYQGGFHTFIYKEDGELLGFGRNSTGQLGINNFTDTLTPVFVMKDNSIRTIACGDNHTLLLKNDGQLFGFGQNGNGELGLGHLNSVQVPTLITKDEKIKSIHCGGQFSLLYKTNGDLFGFGSNVNGQLGIKTQSKQEILPHFVLNDKTIKKISTGIDYSFMLKEDGDLFCWGGNTYSQLGFSKTVVPSQKSPQLLMSDEKIQDIGCGARHSMILKSNGELFVMGSNDKGQLGFPSSELMVNEPKILVTDETIQSIFCGYQFSMIYKSNGTLLSFGFNEYGQIGNGSTVNQYTPFETMNKESLLIINGGTRINEWSPNNHKFYTSSLKTSVLYLMLSLKRNQKKNNIKIPKFVVYEIIKRAAKFY